MKENMKYRKIGLIGTHKNPKVAQTVLVLIQLLKSWDIEILIEQETFEELKNLKDLSEDSIFSDLPIFNLDELPKHCDCGIVIGGDGNLIRVARSFSLLDIPIIGINRGQLGYLTDINPDMDLAVQLKPILKGVSLIEHRFLIQAEVYRAGKKINSGSALNDIVLFPGEIAQMIEFELKINNTFVYSQRSDGLIISTPTGSTAYNLSAGGPILQPDMQALILVPMFPHTLTSRPIVVDASSEIKIYITDDNKTAPRLSYDGQVHVNLQVGDEIKICKQVQTLQLLHAQDYDYYSVLRAKLHWGTQLVKLKMRDS